MRSWPPLGSEELLRYEGEYVYLLSINVVNPKSDNTAVIPRPRNQKEIQEQEGDKLLRVRTV